MENWTLAQISVGIAFIVTLIGGFKYIANDLKKVTEKALKPTNDKIDNMEKHLTAEIKKTDMNATKNFLVRTLHDLKRGEQIDDISKERFFEQYEHYKEIGGNSYIANEVNKLQKEGRL